MTQITESWISDATAQAFLLAAEEAGFVAYFVGGCVRNALLGLPANDLDIATSANPQQVIALAKALGFKPVPTGIEHGTITVVDGATVLEVTTFRKDVETDGRRAVVAFAETLEEDAQRRDFRMNALYANRQGEVLDPTGGLEDIAAKRLCFAGNAEERIREDYLRIVRLFRFAAKLGFGAHGLDKEAVEASARLSYGLSHVSRERQTAEILKLLSSTHLMDVLKVMQATGVLARVLPGASLPAFERYLEHEEAITEVARLACLTYFVDVPQLRLSNDQSKRLRVIKSYGASDIELEEFAYLHGAQLAVAAARVAQAVFGGALSEAKLQAARWAAEQTFPVTAQDLMPHLQGKALGQALKKLEREWIASGFKRSKASLLNEE